MSGLVGIREAASALKVAPSTITRYLRQYPELVQREEGRARPKVDLEQLRRHRANNLSPDLAPATHPPAAEAPAAPTAQSPAPMSEADEHTLRYRRAKAQQAETDAELSRRRLRETEGAYMRADDAKAAWSAQLTEQLRDIEAWWPDLASRLAAETGADSGAILTRLRSEWRAWRERRAARARTRAAELPELVPDPELAAAAEGEADANAVRNEPISPGEQA